MSRVDVVTRLTESLDGVADRFDPAIPRFDPRRAPSVALPDEAAAGRPRSRRRLAVAAAAVALVVGIASFLALRHDDPAGDPSDVRTSSDTPSRPADAPDGALVPTWLPEGMQAWSVQWWHPVQRPQRADGPARDQVFADAGGSRRIKLEIRHGAFPVDDGSGRTVRGQSSMAAGTGAADQPAYVSWLEEGDYIQAWGLGLGLDDLTAFLDGLQRRSTGVLRGFDPPAGSDLQPAGEAFQPEGEHGQQGLTVVYGRGVPLEAQPDDLVVVETAAPTGELGLAYVDARFWGTTGADGTVVVADGDRRSWVRPDGSRVAVTPQGGVTAADAERVAASVAPATAAELVELRDDAEAWAETAPRLVEMGLSSSVTVVVVGARDLPLVCARLSAEDRLRCYGWDRLRVVGSTALLTAGFEGDDGRWYAVAVARGVDRLSWRQRLPAPASPGVDLPAEGGFADEWTVSVAPVPEGVDGVAVGFGGDPVFDQRRDWAR